MTELHLTDEQLAALADESMGEAQRAFLEEHLRQCRSCHEAYRETVRYRAMVMADPSVFRAPDAAVVMARAIARPAGKASAGLRPRSVLLPRLAFGMAAAAVVVASLSLWQSLSHRQDRWIEPLQQAAASASAEGSIVLPGVEGTVSATSAHHRSGFVQRNEVIGNALTELSRTYNQDASPEVAHWLISGYLATGDVETAGMYVQNARLRYPEDARFLVLDAIVAYRSDDLERAEKLLQTALGADPRNGAAMLNLALVQYEGGQWDSARRTLEMVRSQFAGSPLETRAATLMADLLGG